jgi:hypothetical protein
MADKFATAKSEDEANLAQHFPKVGRASVGARVLSVNPTGAELGAGD